MVTRCLLALGLFVSLTWLVVAADPKKPADAGTPTKIDWSDWVDFAVMTGEVTKIEKDGSFKLSQKVTTMRPPTRPGQRPTPSTKVTSQQMTFAEQGLVRYKELPVKLDEKGKRTPYKPEELKELRLPQGTPGYATDRSSLQVGQYVEVQVIRPKSVKPNEVAPQDLRVKWVIIHGPATASTVSSDDKKDPKKDEKKDKKDEKKEK